MMADSQLSVGGAIGYAWTLWRERARSIWGVLALASLAATVLLAGDLSNNQQITLVGQLAAVVCQLMVQGAVFRLALADLHPGDPAFVPGPSGVQWRRMEWRLLGASLLAYLFLAIVVVLCAVVVLAVPIGILINKGLPPTALQDPAGLASILGTTGQASLVVLFFAAVAVVINFGFRLSLVGPTTADTGQISVLKTWPSTKGQVSRIFVTLVAINLSPLLIGVSVVTAIAAADQPGLTTSTQLSPGAVMISALVMGAMMGGFVAPMTAAALAYYYRNLKGRTA